jgi:hypothetical protein
MTIDLLDNGECLDAIVVDGLTKEEAYEVMDQVRDIVRKRR